MKLTALFAYAAIVLFGVTSGDWVGTLGIAALVTAGFALVVLFWVALNRDYL